MTNVSVGCAPDAAGNSLADGTMSPGGGMMTRNDGEEQGGRQHKSAAGAAAMHRMAECRRWLSAITPNEAEAMEHKREFRDFFDSFDRLCLMYRRHDAVRGPHMIDPDVSDVFKGQDGQNPPTTPSSSLSFLQRDAADDILLRVFEFLECKSLVRAGSTCSRLNELCHRCASQRTATMANTRQLSSVMQLLRAKEQLEGTTNGSRDEVSGMHVRIPTLLLSRRVRVSGCGDSEYNGIYYWYV